MPPTTIAGEDVLAHCSFCGKPDTAVERLVAGPGVYICNEFVALSTAVLERAARATPAASAQRRERFRRRPTGDVLAMLPALVRSADRVEADLAGSVARLRERGTGWDEIAGAVGMSVAAARRRFDGGSPEAGA